MLAMMFMRKGQAAVGAPVDLGFVDVDEDARMPQGSAPAVAADDPLRGPPHRLFVDQGDGGLRLGLRERKKRGGQGEMLAM